MSRRSRAFGAKLAVLVLLAVPCAAAAQQVAPYGANDYGGFHNVLPPGTNGLVNATDLAGWEATQARPAHSADQLGMYSNLVFAAPGLQVADLDRYFKDATFGVKLQDVASTISPEPGVTIVRDRPFGVPHINGATRPALMFGIGYATAQDRLFFIDVLRHLGRGELTAFVGGSSGNRAFDAMQWGIAPYTEEDLQNQITLGVTRAGTVGRQIYDDAVNYVAGINDYIARAKLNPAMMPGEYAAIGKPLGPDQFELSDLVATASLVGGIFGAGGGGQLGNAQLFESFVQRFGPADGPRYFADFAGNDDPEVPTTVAAARFPYELPTTHITPGSVAMPDAGSVVGLRQQVVTGGDRRAPADDSSLGGQLQRLLSQPHGNSNALLVSGGLSQSGHPLAVFGPQVAYFNPQILMEQDIHGPGIDATGASFPGVNLYVELGHGPDYAWSATSAGQTITDVFALRLCNRSGGPVTLDSTDYEFQGQCLPMTPIRRFNSWTPNLADSTPAGTETLTAYRTALGLLTARGRVGGVPVAFVKDRATYGHELDSAIGFEQFNDPSAIRDARDFQVAAANIGYTFNWLYADSRHIAYFNSGQNPIRSPGVDPRFPTWGAFPWQHFDPATNLSDYAPFDQHPQVIDQPVLTSWNNKQAHGYQLDGSPIFRSQLLDDAIAKRVAGGRKIQLTDLIDAMEEAATVDLRANKVLPYALKIIGQPDDPALAPAVAELSAWVADGAHRRSPAPGQPYAHADAIRIWDAWYPLLVRAVFEAGLGSQLFGQTGVAHDDTPEGGGAHHGSSWETDAYGQVQKDLREVVGLPVTGRFHRVWCGGGRLTGCRAALVDALTRAAAESLTRVYPGDSQCSAGDQRCWDSIEFFPLGAVHQPLIPWQNRPTFQQAVEINGHRGFPARPACIYDRQPTVALARARVSAGGFGLRGQAAPLDCGDGQFAISRVRFAIGLRVGYGRCRFAGRRGLGRSRRCARPVWRTARGRMVWSVRGHVRLPAGRYVVSVQALDRAGNVASASRSVRVH